HGRIAFLTAFAGTCATTSVLTWRSAFSQPVENLFAGFVVGLCLIPVHLIVDSLLRSRRRAVTPTPSAAEVASIPVFNSEQYSNTNDRRPIAQPSIRKKCLIDPRNANQLVKMFSR